MPMRVLYEAGVSATSEDITNRVRLYTLDLSQKAEEGSVAVSEMRIDDPSGDYEVIGWRRIRVYEDSATSSNTLTYNGWVADRRVSRQEFVTGAGRKWVTSLADMNSIISMRVLTQSGADRPAETDVQRIQWLMGITEMNRVVETEFINTSNARNMDAVDYRGQTLIDVISDCAQTSGKNYFVYTKDNGVGASLTLGLWYDHFSSTAYTSSIRLSNVSTDVDNSLTFAISKDTELVRDPSRVYSGAYVNYDGGAVYEESTPISNQFTRRDAVYNADNVKNGTTATARALRYLGDTGTEEDRITTSYYVPAAKVNFLREGMRCQIKATHLPGYESFVWARVLSRSVAEVAEETSPSTAIKYLVSLELSASPVACGDLALSQNSTVKFGAATTALPSAPTQCLQIWVQSLRTTPANVEPTPPPGFTQAGWAYTTGGGNNGSVGIAYRVTQVGDTGSIPDYGFGGDRAHILLEFAGIDTFSAVSLASDQPNASSITSTALTPASGRQLLLVGVAIKSDSGIPGGNSLPAMATPSPATQLLADTGTLVSHDQGPTITLGYRLVTASVGSYQMTFTGDSTGFATGPWGYVVAAFVS